MSSSWLPDSGLQRERTALAWNRTTLAMLVNALLVLRAGVQQESKFIAMLGLGMLVSAVAFGSYAFHRKAQLSQSTPPSAPSAWVVLMTAALSGSACLALIVVLWTI